MRRRRILAVVVATATLAELAVAGPLTPAAPAQAAFATEFDPGNIISDQVFYASGAMSAAQVQAFLDAKGAGCSAGQQPCLKDYTGTSIAEPVESGICNGYPGNQTQTAAQLIVGVATSCGINPQVLLVLLQKEQSLITRTAPSTSAYRAATGFGCPDTSGCDPQQSGLFKQLYSAARQFQRYAAYPASYGYQAGRSNSILYNPNSGCGRASVFIANQATAGLYDYTPYVPNAAALNNLYGTGDSCSSYGNRNFWVFFTDWFGSTQVTSYLMRSTTNATVYLVSGDSKYPIPTMAQVNALSRLGSVAYVSQQYLDRRTTGPTLQYSLHAPDGTMHPFTSCTQVSDYGMSCGSLVSIDATMVDKFAVGATVRPIVTTTSGRTYWVTGGTRREAADAASLTAAGVPGTPLPLSDTSLGSTRLGPPVVRDGIIVRGRASGAALLIGGGTALKLPTALLGVAGLSSRPTDPLDDASLALQPTSGTLSPIVRDASTSVNYVLTTAGKAKLTDTGALPASPTSVPSAILATIPDTTAAPSPVFVKEPSRGAIYLVRNGALRPVAGMSQLVLLSGATAPSVRAVPDGVAALLPAGPYQVAPGTLIKSPDSGTVYLVTGLDRKATLMAFSVTDELGISGVTTLPTASVNGYTSDSLTVRTALTCGTTTYLGLSGTLYAASADMAARYALAPMPVESAVCDRLKVSATPLDRFLRVPNGTIYLMESGQKRPIGAYSKYVSLGGTSANTINVTTTTAARFPTGPNA